MSRTRPAPSPYLAPSLLLVAALIVIAPLAAAQGAVVVEEDEAYPSYQDVRGTGDVTFGWTVWNIHPGEAYLVTVQSRDPGISINVTPASSFFVAPRERVPVRVTMPIESAFNGERQFSFDFIVRSENGTSAPVTFTQTVKVFSHDPRILGIFANPLPPPLDNEWGVFLLDIAFWAGFGLVALFFGNAIVYRLTRHARAATTKVILTKLRTPIFLLVLTIGIQSSFGVLPDTSVVRFFESILAAVAIIFGTYVAYQAMDSFLYYYKQEIAPRTATQLDDILIPALRKIGAGVLFGVALFLVLKRFNVDLTVLLGGAAVASLVIAFAAQDTLSNFFSGIFLLVDRPFIEGDDVQIETGEICRVEKIGLRSTRLYHYRNHEMIVLPNNQLATRRVVNLAGPDLRYRISFEIGVAYGTPIEKVRKIILDIMDAHPDVVHGSELGKNCWFSNFADSSLVFSAGCFVKNFRERHRVLSEIRTQVYEAFARERIEIPFPQRTLWIKGAGDGAPAAIPGAPPTER